MIQELANIIYTPANIQSAGVYLQNRGVDISKMRYPPALTGTDTNPYWVFKKQYPVSIFTESIYFPITDIEEPTRLVGFDVRYVGGNKTRLRYHKFKEENKAIPIYYTEELHKIDAEKPLLVTEGIVDAETIRGLGYPVISPLTAMHSFKFCLFLRAISNNIYFAYDNDDAGKRAKESIKTELSPYPELQKHFRFLTFTGKDLNDSFKKMGRDYLYNIVKAQIIERIS